ncbi:MAG: heparan-alpha-glucosaminide N-acetyltransferase domain-containing protein [Spirochaetales bacterium]
MSSLNRPRVESVDLLRGLVMILMLLDHTRSGWNEGTGLDPLDLVNGSPALFLTRWVTHFCAPVFVLLTGLSASLARSGSLKLLRRGATLIALELLVVSILWGRVFFLGSVLFQVIWAIGFGLVVLAGLKRLGHLGAALVGIAIIAGHNALPNLTFDNSVFQLLWALMHQHQSVVIAGFTFEVLYPALPWAGVLALGYGLGGLYLGVPGGDNGDTPGAQARRRTVLAVGGAVAVLAFFVLRHLNGYGDPRPWRGRSSGGQASTLLTFLDLLKVEKYPPSLDYLLMTLGPALLSLAAFDGLKPSRNNLLTVLGRNALFYYFVHLLVLAVVLVAADGVLVVVGVEHEFGALPFRFDLGYTYLVWALLLPVLYGLCRAWENRKRKT